VSSATLGDLEAFRVWLAVPYLPAEGWPAVSCPSSGSAAGEARLRGLSIGSRRRADTTIRSFFRFLHEGGYLAANPCMKLGKLTGEEISHDELEKLQLSPSATRASAARRPSPSTTRTRARRSSIALWRWLRSFLDSDENTWQIPDSPSLEATRPGAGPLLAP
jgi:site-specific recombinase XerD